MEKTKRSDIKNGILRILVNDTGNFTSGEAMSLLFGVSRAALWKHIEGLRHEGYQIESFPRKGYKLKSGPDRIVGEDIITGLKTAFIGQKRIHCFDSVASTNEEAHVLAMKGAPEGTIVIAETQTAGRGRMGRKWISPPLVGLYFSIILRPEMRIDEMPALTLAVADAIVKAISGHCMLSAKIKWPNDVFIGEKKVCGILTETLAHADRTDFLVIGIGINLNTEIKDLPVEATSISNETGKKIDRPQFFTTVLEKVESAYTLYVENGFTAFRDEVKKASNVLGRYVSVVMRERKISGIAVDIDERGALLIKDDGEKIHRIFSGDVIASGFKGVMKGDIK